MAQLPKPDITYPFDGRPDAGSAMEIASGILWVRMPLPFQLDHINLYLLADGDGWTLVDTGYGDDRTKEIWQQVWDAHLGGRPVRRLIVTHFHPDHIGNSRWLWETWGIFPHMTNPEWLSANLAAGGSGAASVELRLKTFARHGLEAGLLELFRTGNVPYAKGVSLPEAFYRMEGGDRVTIGDRTWLVVIGRGHSVEHACLYCAADNILLAGDQLLPSISSNVSVLPQEPLGDPLRQFLDSLDELKAVVPEDVLVLPSHGRPFTGAHRRIDWLHDHHDARLASAMKNVAGPTAAGDLLGILFPVELDGHQVSFAMGETIAHLNHLMHAGRLMREEDADGMIRFTPMGDQ